MSDTTDPTDISQLVTNATVRELPPSCKLVWLVLSREGVATQQAIIEVTDLSGRTVRYALTRLAEVDVIEERPYLDDARQSVYSLTDHGR